MGAWNETMMGNDYALDLIGEFQSSSNKFSFYSKEVYQIAGQLKNQLKNKDIYEVLRNDDLTKTFQYDSYESMKILGLTEYILDSKKLQKNDRLLSFIKEKKEFLTNLILLEGHNSVLSEWSDQSKRAKALLEFKIRLEKLSKK